MTKYLRDFYWFYRKIILNILAFLLAPFPVLLSPEKFARSKRILVISPDGMIGDFILLSPFIRELRRLMPESYIALAVPDKIMPLASNCPYVNEVIQLPSLGRTEFIGGILKNIVFGRFFLRKFKFESAILTTDNFDYKFGSFAIFGASIPLRIGYGRENAAFLHPRKTEVCLDRLLSCRIPFVSDSLHQSEIYLNILRFLFPKEVIATGKPEIWVAESDRESCKLKCAELFARYQGRLFIVIAISSSSPKKNWPLACNAELVRLLSARFNPVFLFIGLKEDSQCFKEIFESNQDAYDLCGKLTLRELFCMMKKADLFIGPDSGPAHVAAAAGVSLVEISSHPLPGRAAAIGSPERFGPMSEHSVIIRPAKALSPCKDECLSLSAHCILNVSTEAVFNAVCSIIKKRNSEKEFR